MTVKDLIKFLKTQPQDLQVIYGLYSEYVLLNEEDISVENACEVRPDGWVHRARPDKPSQKYLCFPGN
jgi:hypothetical protein